MPRPISAMASLADSLFRDCMAPAARAAID